MKTAIILFLTLISYATYAQDSNVLIGLNYPIYGIKIKSNFPTGSGGFARGFTVSNQDASSDFIMLGVNGSYSTLKIKAIYPESHPQRKSRIMELI